MLGLRTLSKKLKGDSLRVKLRTIKYELLLAWQRAWKGYDDTQWYQMDSTFIDLYKALFTDFIDNAHSYCNDMTFQEWQDIKKHFIILLNDMDYDEDYELAIKSKDEFFILFSKYFYDLWD